MIGRPARPLVGPHRPSSELPFHRTIYEQRPDLRSVLHAHPPALVAFSIVRKVPQTNLIPNVLHQRIYERQPGINAVIIAHPPSAMVFAVTDAVFDSRTIDSLVVAGTTLLDAFDRLEVAEYSAKAIIAAGELGEIVAIDHAAEAAPAAIEPSRLGHPPSHHW